MRQTTILYQKFSSVQTYMEVYSVLSVSSREPAVEANYVWTAVLSKSDRDIPRAEDGRQIFTLI